MNFSINNRALQIIEEKIMPNLDNYNITIHTLKNGATVLDMGVKARGGWMAGKYFAETGMGGLGTLSLKTMRIADRVAPVAAITLDQPNIAELSSYCANFFVPYRGRNVSLSGPIRAIKGDDNYAAEMSYRDPSPRKAVCHIQTDELPTEELLEIVAGRIGFSPKDIVILAANTGGLTGAVQICARNVEQTLPTLVDRGFNVHCIVQASGYAPISSPTDDGGVAMGRVNDCLIYGQETNLYLDCEDEEITSILDELTFVKNDIYGTPFATIFQMCENDWAKVPRDWDAPCKVNFHNMRTNHTFCTGKLNMDILSQGQ